MILRYSKILLIILTITTHNGYGADTATAPQPGTTPTPSTIGAATPAVPQGTPVLMDPDNAGANPFGPNLGVPMPSYLPGMGVASSPFMPSSPFVDPYGGGFGGYGLGSGFGSPFGMPMMGSQPINLPPNPTRSDFLQAFGIRIATLGIDNFCYVLMQRIHRWLLPSPIQQPRTYPEIEKLARLQALLNTQSLLIAQNAPTLGNSKDLEEARKLHGQAIRNVTESLINMSSHGLQDSKPLPKKS